jgi:dTDP-4-dehydrorhamnose reductase
MGCLLDNLNWEESQTEFLILGSGFISQAYQKFFDQNEIFYTALSRTEVNYTDYLTLKLYLTDNRPKFLINAAGYTGSPNVDSCESNRAACYLGNVELPLVIARVCKELDIPWGHVSSGCVYYGDNEGVGFTEDDPPNFSFAQNNCSYYSGTKALAEQLLSGYDNLFIWRIRMPFSHINHPKNYLTKILTYSTLVDARNSLSNLEDFVRASYQLISRAPFGTYNICNSGSITTREITEIIREKYPNKQFSFFDTYEDFEKIVKAPRSNCVLDTSKIEKYVRLSHVAQGVRESVFNWTE